MQFVKHLQQEIDTYKNGSVGDTSYSEYKLKKRIYQFKSKYYPKGKLTERGAYKYYFDIITPRVNDEQKNVRVTTGDITFYSIAPEADVLQTIIANRNYELEARESGETARTELTSSLYTEDGNVIVKIIGDKYEVCDPLNIYVTNTQAESIEDTNVIQKADITQTELRKKKGVWNNEGINALLTQAPNRKTIKDGKISTTPIYTIYEYTGEISEADYKELGGELGGNPDKYIFAKVIISDPDNGEVQTLFREDLSGKKMTDFYRHVGRGNYKGRFWREGMYEILFDHQIRANEIGNQIARGLEIASTAVFAATDLRTYSSIKTDLISGDIINSTDLRQVDVRMHGLDQLIADWNRLIQDANRVANSSEIVYGGQLTARTPFKLGNMYNENANKYFGLLKDKLGHFIGGLVEDIYKKEYLKKISGKDIIILSGTDEMLQMLRRSMVEAWYMNNLVEIGPHSKEEVAIIKEEKLLELSEKDITVKNTKDFWGDSIARIKVAVVGENKKIQDNLQNITVLLQMETDPIRRAYLLDKVYSSLGVPLPPAPNPEIPQAGSGGMQMEDYAERETIPTAGQSQPSV